MYDVHTHFIPTEVIRWLREHQSLVQAEWNQKEAKTSEFLRINGKWEFELKPYFLQENLYLQTQEQAGIRHSLVSPVPQLFLYELEPAITAELAAVYNDSLVRWTRSHPARLSALATLPLNRPEQAAAELERAMNLGLRGAIVATSWQGHRLSDDCFAPFWEMANAKRAIVFLHPLLSTDPRLNRRMMPNLIGIPWETTVCATDLVLSGTLERYPDVKILLAHGGGYFPFQLGRVQKGYETWPAVSTGVKQSPKELARRFWYDSVLWSRDSLQLLISLVGEEKVVPGTDFPFDLCDFPPMINGEKSFHRLLEADLSIH
ncbi:amidohydrolase family protein [Brevibacillus fulvus]|uniref:Aminocarboxymuconate-semialdehyde decarboxylase n=1 Tax=Brevibacillus fulvus TaxID=1125967 RepID=A0A939BTY9_9BACL|nr:amidohydrolase family protein [Brevibacillus fulvus]MBM7588961.1 aminocarboxymuconate-semialdehyde decarboxylase [Brevibacillus fulvus]